MPAPKFVEPETADNVGAEAGFVIEGDDVFVPGSA